MHRTGRSSLLRLAAPKKPRLPLTEEIYALAEQIQTRSAAHPLMVPAIKQYVACFSSGGGPTDRHAQATSGARRRMCRAILP
jgi:hypothetical protein